MTKPKIVKLNKFMKFIEGYEYVIPLTNNKNNIIVLKQKKKQILLYPHYKSKSKLDKHGKEITYIYVNEDDIVILITMDKNNKLTKPKCYTVEDFKVVT